MMKVRNLLAVTVLAGAAALIPGAAQAAPNFLGPSGYILTPDATVVPNMCIAPSYHYFGGRSFERDFGLNGSAVRARFECPDMSTASASLGLFDRIELNGTWFNVHGPDEHADQALLNLKGTLLGANSPVQVAGGAYDALNEWDRGAYVVGSVNVGEKMKHKFLPRSLRVGGGYGTGSFIDGLFANGSFLLGPNVELMGEWIDGQDRSSVLGECIDGEVNVGARFRLPSMAGLALDVAALGVDKDDPIWAGGISYTHCFGKKHKKHEKEDKEEEGRQSLNIFEGRQGSFGLRASK